PGCGGFRLERDGTRGCFGRRVPLAVWCLLPPVERRRRHHEGNGCDCGVRRSTERQRLGRVCCLRRSARPFSADFVDATENGYPRPARLLQRFNFPELIQGELTKA